MTDYENFTFYDWYKIHYEDEVKYHSVEKEDLKDLYAEYKTWCEKHLFTPSRLMTVSGLYEKR